MLFLIIGPDTFRARQKLNELRAKFRREVDPNDLNISSVSAEAIEASALRHYFSTIPFLSRRRCVIFENFFLNKNKEVFTAAEEIIKKEPDEGNVVIFFESAPPKTKNSFYLWLLSHAHVQQFEPLDRQKLAAWITTAFRNRQRDVESRAVAELIDLTGSDLWRLDAEVKKIDAYLSAGEPVNEEAVSQLSDGPWSDDIFSLIDAIVNDQLSLSARLLIRHLEQNTSAQQLVALLEKQIRILILLSENRNQGSAPQLPGVHPYTTKRLWPVAKRLNAAKLKLMYLDLASVDLALKTSVSDEKTILLNFLIRSSFARGA